MKFLHLSDLHIGKSICNYSMLEDQKYIFNQILSYIKSESAEAIVISGDIYDRSNPSGEAVSLFDDFLSKLAKTAVPVLIISGNHDSPQRLSFASSIFNERGIYVYAVFNSLPKTVCLEDEYGPVNFHLLPFLKPATVKHFYPDEEINSSNDAVAAVINKHDINTEQRNILVAHQFVVASGSEPQMSDSETSYVGGSDSVNSSIFDNYDYVALGHLHKPQQMGRKNVRYGGSPLKYSFSEHNHEKCLTLIEIKEKGDISHRLLPLAPLRDMRKIKGPIDVLLSDEVSSRENKLDYLHITLTDPEEISEPMAKLKSVYPNTMELNFDNLRSRSQSLFNEDAKIESKNSIELFSDFYAEQNGEAPDDIQIQILSDILKEAGDIL